VHLDHGFIDPDGKVQNRMHVVVYSSVRFYLIIDRDFMEAQRKVVCNITACRSFKISPDDDLEAINDRCTAIICLPNTEFSKSRARGAHFPTLSAE